MNSATPAPTLPPGTRDTIPVVVRLGSTNIARASSGKLAKLASSTNSGRVAALSAAAKYFRCPEADVRLTLLSQGSTTNEKPARYMAERRES